MKQKSINCSRLVHYLQLLKPADYEPLLSFLNSPFFNRRQDAVDLFNLLWKTHPHFEKPIFRQEISAKLYKTETGKPLSPKEDNKVRNLMSRLVTLIETYFIQVQQQKQTLLQKRWLLDALIARKSFKLAYQKLKAIKEKHQAGEQNAAYYYNDYLLEEANFYLNVLTKQRSRETTVVPVVESLSSYALTNLFLYYCAGVNLQLTVKQKFDFKLLPFLNDYLKQNLNEQPAILQIYYHILHMLVVKEEGPSHFKSALDLVTQHGSRFSFVDRRHIYSFLLNFCGNKIRDGAAAYRKYRYQIYKECLVQELWVTNSYLPAHHFVIHLKNMLHLQKYQETATFIQEATPTLPPKYRENIPTLCQSMSAFYQGQLEKCHDLLLQIDKLDDYLFVLFQKILTIQLFLEKKEDSLTRSSVQSLQAYLRPARNKNISPIVEEGFRNFAAFSLRLLHYRENKEYDSRSPRILAKLHADIQASKSLYEREWLLGVTGDTQ